MYFSTEGHWISRGISHQWCRRYCHRYHIPIQNHYWLAWMKDVTWKPIVRFEDNLMKIIKITDKITIIAREKQQKSQKSLWITDKFKKSTLPCRVFPTRLATRYRQRNSQPYQERDNIMIEAIIESTYQQKPFILCPFKNLFIYIWCRSFSFLIIMKPDTFPHWFLQKLPNQIKPIDIFHSGGVLFSEVKLIFLYYLSLYLYITTPPAPRNHW